LRLAAAKLAIRRRAKTRESGNAAHSRERLEGVSVVADTKATDCPLLVTPIFGKMNGYGMSKGFDATKAA
jgi:hypothetical protein